MKKAFSLIIVVVLLIFAGCETKTPALIDDDFTNEQALTNTIWFQEDNYYEGFMVSKIDFLDGECITFWGFEETEVEDELFLTPRITQPFQFLNNKLSIYKNDRTTIDREYIYIRESNKITLTNVTTGKTTIYYKSKYDNLFYHARELGYFLMVQGSLDYWEAQPGFKETRRKI